MAGTQFVHLQGKWGRKAHSPGTAVLKDCPCAARCVINNSSHLVHFSCFYFSSADWDQKSRPGRWWALWNPFEAMGAAEGTREANREAPQLQRMVLKAGIILCFQNLPVGHSSRFLACHNLAAQMIGCSQCSCWAWQKVSAQPSWKK